MQGRWGQRIDVSLLHPCFFIPFSLSLSLKLILLKNKLSNTIVCMFVCLFILETNHKLSDSIWHMFRTSFCDEQGSSISVCNTVLQKSILMYLSQSPVNAPKCGALSKSIKTYSFTPTLQNRLKVKTVHREMRSQGNRLPEAVASRLDASVCLKCQYLLSSACGLQTGTEDERCLTSHKFLPPGFLHTK